MTTMPDTHELQDGDLRAMYALQDVRMYEVACRTDTGFRDDKATIASRELRKKRRADGEPDGEEQRWDITISVSAKRIECRARVMVQLRECRYLVDAASIYSRSDGSTGSSGAKRTKDEPPEAALVKFIEEEALPTLYPYLRAEIHQAAVKIRGSRRVFTDLTTEGVRRALRDAQQNAEEPPGT